MSNQDENGKGIVFWVPQLFFDIIARLIPGPIIIGAISFAYVGPAAGLCMMRNWLAKPSDSYPPVTLLIGALFGVSYTFAIILRGIGRVLSLLYSTIRGSRKSKEAPTPGKHNDFSMKYDFIKRNDPSAGGRITKLHAEESMTKVLILGFVISFAINLWKWLGSLDVGRLQLGLILLLAVIGSIGANYHFARRIKTAVENYAALLGYS